MAKAKTSKTKGKKQISQKTEWRKFEELVKEIETFYINNQDVKIKCPDKLLDLMTGTKREIDLTITFKVGSTPVIIAFECRKRNKIQDVTWIEQLAQKQRNCGIGVLWAVSEKGFSKEAQHKAKHLGIKLRKLSCIKPTDIPNSLSMEVDFEYHKFSSLKTTFDRAVASDHIETMKRSVESDERIFRFPGIEYVYSTSEMCNIIIRDGKINGHFKNSKVPENGESEKYNYIRNFDEPTKNFYIDINNTQYYIKTVSMDLVFGIKEMKSSQTTQYKLEDEEKKVEFTSFVIGDINSDYLQFLYTEHELVKEKVRQVNGSSELYYRLLKQK